MSKLAVAIESPWIQEPTGSCCHRVLTSTWNKTYHNSFKNSFHRTRYSLINGLISITCNSLTQLSLSIPPPAIKDSMVVDSHRMMIPTINLCKLSNFSIFQGFVYAGHLNLLCIKDKVIILILSTNALFVVSKHKWIVAIFWYSWRVNFLF